MPNLQGANPVGHDDGDHLYVAWTIDRTRPGDGDHLTPRAGS